MYRTLRENQFYTLHIQHAHAPQRTNQPTYVIFA